MDFKIAMEHVRDGTATEEERQLVDSEVDKYLLITEHLDAQLESEWPPLPEALPELKQLRIKLRRRNAVLILTCLLLVAVIAAAAAACIFPKMEKKQQAQVQQQVQQEVAPQVQQQLEDKEKAQAEENAKYWDPTLHTYSERFSDLHLTMDCYAEMHMIGFREVSVGTPIRTDIGTYQIPIRYIRQTKFDPRYLETTLEKGVFTFPSELEVILYQNLYGYMSSLPAEEDLIIITPDRVTEEIAENYKIAIEELEPLPDYVSVVADVTFPDYMDMEELIAFYELYKEKMSIGWVGIRSSQGLCGMSPFSNFNGAKDVEGYPHLQLSYDAVTAENLEQHYKSMLRFAQDQLDKGCGIARYEDPNYYSEELDFVEKYGVYAYGCRITVAPDMLIEFLENGVIIEAVVVDKFIR